MTDQREQTGDSQTPRRRARRRFAAFCGALAAVLLAAGVAGARSSGVWQAMGIAAVGYGVGLGVAAAFLAAGHNPLSRR